MVNRIESMEAFVERLQQDGVEAGKVKGAEIVAEAESRAQSLLHQVQAEAEQIRSAARREAELIISRGKTELEQAARDVLLKLKGMVDQSLHRILLGAMESELQDTEFLKSLIHEVAGAYVKADLGRHKHTVCLTDQTKAQIESWALRQLSAELNCQGELTLTGALRGGGFEVRQNGAALEVTPESLTDLLVELVSPGVRALIAPQKNGSREAV